MRFLPCVTLVALVACTDVRDYAGDWSGPRVGDAPQLQVGISAEATADLRVNSVDRRGLAGSLRVDGLIDRAEIRSLEGAEADVLAGITFAGSPLRVYLAFAATEDGAGDVLAVISLHDGERIELRLLRGGDMPVYAVFALRPA